MKRAALRQPIARRIRTISMFGSTPISRNTPPRVRVAKSGAGAGPAGLDDLPLVIGQLTPANHKAKIEPDQPDPV